MLKFKSICEIELLKKEYKVVDTLVRANKSIEILGYGSIFNYELHLVANYLNKIATDKDSIVKFFQDAIENDIVKEKYWVSYLDTHMEYRYVEDGETLYGYETENSSPLAIRGREKDVTKFVKTILFLANEVERDFGDHKNGIPKSIISRSKINKIIVDEECGDLHKFTKSILKEINFEKLKEDFDDIEVEKFNIDRAYYEQRPYACPV